MAFTELGQLHMCILDSCGSGQGVAVSFCEHCNEPSEFYRRWRISLPAHSLAALKDMAVHSSPRFRGESGMFMYLYVCVFLYIWMHACIDVYVHMSVHTCTCV